MAKRKNTLPPIKKISSRQNPFLKSLKRAFSEGTTDEGFLAVEGPHLIEESIAAGFRPRVVLVTPSGRTKFGAVLRRLHLQTERIEVPEAVFRSFSSTKTPQGIAALVERRRAHLNEILNRPKVFIPVACGLQDPGNLGALWRASLALGASALMTVHGTARLFQPKTIRASAGAIFRLPVFENWSLRDLIRKLRSSNVLIFAADARGNIPLHGANFGEKAALLIGAEGAGLPEEVQGEADALVRIPIRPECESLNAASAGMLFLYEAARQRGFRYYS